jgi:hypothetical protein
MSINVNFYITGDNPNVMNKTLTLIAENVPCDIKEPADSEKPFLFTTGDLMHANYAYIEHFGRYYWVYPETGQGMTTRYRLESDPLIRFRAGILSSPAVIARNPWHFDLYVPDPKLPVEARTASAVLPFPNKTIFDGNNNSYILTTLGSGS